MAEKISDMIKKEAGVDKGTGDRESVGEISLEKLVEIAKSKEDVSLGASLKAVLKEAAGTCKSMGIKIDGKDGQQVIREIEEGKHDSLVAGK